LGALMSQLFNAPYARPGRARGPLRPSGTARSPVRAPSRHCRCEAGLDVPCRSTWGRYWRHRPADDRERGSAGRVQNGARRAACRRQLRRHGAATIAEIPPRGVASGEGWRACASRLSGPPAAAIILKRLVPPSSSRRAALPRIVHRAHTGPMPRGPVASLARAQQRAGEGSSPASPGSAVLGGAPSTRAAAASSPSGAPATPADATISCNRIGPMRR
jgi:hypothetical protein